MFPQLGILNATKKASLTKRWSKRVKKAIFISFDQVLLFPLSKQNNFVAEED
jgi:hypothetical protein